MSAGRMIYLAAGAICLATPATAAEFELGFCAIRTNNDSGLPLGASGATVAIPTWGN
jgi:hypothetical protein